MRQRVFDPLTGAPSSIGALGSFLTPPSAPGSDPLSAVRQFIDENAALFGHDSSALAASRVTRDDVTAHNGMHTVAWQQQVDGVPMVDTLLKANLTRDGALVTLGSYFMGDAEGATQMSAAERAALIAAPPIDAME